MDICHEHNLDRDPELRRRYGIRVSLPATDPLSRVLGETFERTHWYGSAGERDRALKDMAREHLYSRRGDRPTLSYEPIDRS